MSEEEKQEEEQEGERGKRVRPSAQRYELLNSSSSSSRSSNSDDNISSSSSSSGMSSIDMEIQNKTSGNKFIRSLKMLKVTPKQKELRFRNRLKNVDILKTKQNSLKCTKCESDFLPLVNEGLQITSHPILKVLYCKRCTDYYGTGEFSLDEDGEDKYCRWCGEGGTLFLCSKCNCGFCPPCIKKHFGDSKVSEVENDDNWACFICYSKPLWELRWICAAAIQKAKAVQRRRDYVRKKRLIEMVERKKYRNLIEDSDESGEPNPVDETQRKKKKRRLSSLSDADDNIDEGFKSVRKEGVQNLMKLYKLAILSSYACQEISTKKIAKLKDISSVKTPEDLLKHYTYIEQICSVLSSNYLAVCNMVSYLKQQLGETGESTPKSEV